MNDQVAALQMCDAVSRCWKAQDAPIDRVEWLLRSETEPQPGSFTLQWWSEMLYAKKPLVAQRGNKTVPSRSKQGGRLTAWNHIQQCKRKHEVPIKVKIWCHLGQKEYLRPKDNLILVNYQEDKTVCFDTFLAEVMQDQKKHLARLAKYISLMGSKRRPLALKEPNQTEQGQGETQVTSCTKAFV